MMDSDQKYEVDRMAEAVKDARSFVEFLHALIEDWRDEQAKERENPSPPFSDGANGWQNGSIDTFLDAAAAWAADSDSVQRRMTTPEDAWNAAAQILLMGKYYE